MEIREFLELMSSRLNADMLADKIEEDTEVFDVIWEIMLEDKDPVSMRAAWTLHIFAKKHPYFFEPHIPAIVKSLTELNSESVIRCLLGILTLVPIPEDQSGVLFDICFDIIESATSGIGHKAYAMTILYNISETEPELKPELLDLFESHRDNESAGVCAKCRILINKLHRDMGLPASKSR